MIANNQTGGDPEKDEAMQTAAELIDAATALGAEIRANRFTFKGYDLADRCRHLAAKVGAQIVGPNPEGA